MLGFLNVQELEENYNQCKLYTKHFAKTFYFASHVLPKQKRQSAYAVYAFCRFADEIADHGSSVVSIARVQHRIDELRNQLRYVYTDSHLTDRKLLAFRDTVFRYEIPQQYFMDLLRGVEMDLTVRRWESFRELEEYCYCVASVVGLIMTKIFGASTDEALLHARDLGTAMQLTNILRDVGEDTRRGRVYIPQEELRMFDYSESELHSGVINENFQRLMQFQVARARRLYERAEQGIPMLTDDGSRFCVRLMARTYGRILDVIEKNNYDVFSRRAHVHALTKATIAISSLRNALPVQNQKKVEHLVHVQPHLERH